MSALTPDETILGLLAYRPQHGYQLLDAFNNPEQLGLIWKLSTSQLYAVLKRLERLGWIVGEELISENAPRRIEYSITKSGSHTLQDWLDNPFPSSSVRRVRVEFPSRLFIAKKLKRPVLPIIQHQREACLRDRTRIEELQASISEGVARLSVEMMRYQLNAVLQWLDHCETTLSAVES
jgi:PadR family transcriptional regulator, regulatory protein AphA